MGVRVNKCIILKVSVLLPPLGYIGNNIARDKLTISYAFTLELLQGATKVKVLIVVDLRILRKK